MDRYSKEEWCQSLVSLKRGPWISTISFSWIFFIRFLIFLGVDKLLKVRDALVINDIAFSVSSFGRARMVLTT